MIATGVPARDIDFLDITFGYLDLDWTKYVEIHDRYKRPTEVDILIGDPSRAARDLSWNPTVEFDEIGKIMVKRDNELIVNPMACPEHLSWRC